MGEPKRIQSLQRGMAVIEHLSSKGSSNLAELNDATGLANATLRRILTTFEDQGWVRRLLAEGRYELCFSFSRSLSAGMRSHPLSEIASPHLIELQRKIGWTSDISICVAPGEIEILETTRLKGSLSPNLNVYGLRPSMVQSAMGRAYAAFCSEAELKIHLEALARNGSREDKLWIKSGQFDQIIKKTRHQKFGEREKDYWILPVDYEPDVEAIAVPILAEGAIFGSLSCLWAAGAKGAANAKKQNYRDLNETAQNIAKSIKDGNHTLEELTFQAFTKN